MLIELALLAGALATTPLGAPVYRPAERAVSNWRLQSVRSLDLDLAAALRFAGGMEPPRLARCVKLNNYWCIKRARWAGEIAADDEGHVAFASADEGAAVAVALLRRYYIDLNRKSAFAIVSRWAPAQCGAGPVAVRGSPRNTLGGIAPRGIGNTLRARFLARHGRGGVARPARVASRGKKGAPRPAMRRSAVPDRIAPMMRAPSIAAGLGERAVALAPISVAALAPARAAREPAAPRIGCASEATRIRNYATAMSAGLVASTDADLRLFEPDGTPAPNLAPVMARMAGVEIGPWRVDVKLIARAIERAKSPAPSTPAPAQPPPQLAPPQVAPPSAALPPVKTPDGRLD